MTELMLIVISVAVSLIADIAVDCGLLMKHKIGSSDYKNALKFARNNRGIVEQQDFIKNINEKLSLLESKLESYSSNSNTDNFDISDLKNDIQRLKEQLSNERFPQTNVEEIVSSLKDLTLRIKKIEDKMQAQNSAAVSHNHLGIEEKISSMNGEIVTIKGELENFEALIGKVAKIENSRAKHNKEIKSCQSAATDPLLDAKISQLYSDISSIKEYLQSYNPNSQLEQIIRQLNAEIVKLREQVDSQQKYIDTVKSKVQDQVSVLTSSKVKIQEPLVTSAKVPKKEEAVSSLKIIVPDEKYVRKLLNDLSEIKEVLGDWEYSKCEKGFQTLLKDGDFDDGEEIMFDVHELIKKYIYGSDTKVSIENWPKLEKYIENAGYTPISVKPGDDINRFKSYFDRPIVSANHSPNYPP